MRPRGSMGEVRVAIRSAIRTDGPMTLRGTVQRACLGNQAALNTFKNMCRSGELEKVGTVREAHCKKAVVLYDLAPPVECAQQDAHDGGILFLNSALSAWR